jgi:hypothetical protein
MTTDCPRCERPICPHEDSVYVGQDLVHSDCINVALFVIDEAIPALNSIQQDECSEDVWETVEVLLEDFISLTERENK